MRKVITFLLEKSLNLVILNNIIILTIIKLDAIDSTNTFLKQLAKVERPKDGTVVVTRNQLAGRGQKGNTWQSIAGQSLCLSMFKSFDKIEAQEQFVISMGVSLAIVDILRSFNVPDISIKWPNDIMSANKKLVGILIENVLEGSVVKSSVIGIGINVNEGSFEELPQASSMFLQTGNKFDLEEVLEKITQRIYLRLTQLDQKSLLSYKSEYEKELFRKDLVSVFERPDGSRLNGIIRGISEIGELIIDTETISLKTVQVKELKLLF